MAWDLGLDRTVLRLIPKFIRNPIMYNWISSLVFPLKYINREFVIFALEKSVEAKISSQTQLLEDYLNTSFNSILPYPETDFIEIQHGTEYAQATFFSTEKDANIIPSTEGHAVLYSKQEVEVGLKVTTTTYFDSEDFGTLTEDFRVSLPKSIEGNQSYVREIISIVDKYNIGTNTYDVVYN